MIYSMSEWSNIILHLPTLNNSHIQQVMCLLETSQHSQCIHFKQFLGSVPASTHDFVSVWVSLSTKNYDSGYDHWYRQNQFMCTHKTNSAYNTEQLFWHDCRRCSCGPRTRRNKEGIIAWASTLQLNISTVYAMYWIMANTLFLGISAKMLMSSGN